MFLWAFIHPLSKILLKTIPPSNLAFFRVLFSMFFFVPMFALAKIPSEEKSVKKRWSAKNWKTLVLLAVIGSFAPTFLQAWGLSFTTASASAVIVNTNPFFVILVAALLLGRKISLQKGVGVTLGIAGVTLVASNGDFSFLSTKFFLGNMLVLGNAFFTGIATVVAEDVSKNLGGFRMQYYTNFLALPLFIAGLVLFGGLNSISSIGIWEWLGLLALGVIFSGFCVGIFNTALPKIGAENAALFKLLIPVISIVYSVVLLDEKLSPVFALGTALVLSGLFLALKDGKRKAAETEKTQLLGMQA